MESLRLFSGGGSAVRFSDFCFWSGFAASFAKFAEGRVSPKIFASELLFSGVCVQSLCFLVLFCLCFCLIVLEHSPESFLKNSLLVRCAFCKKFSGANFWFWPFVSGRCFLVVFRLCFCFIVLEHSPESCLKKFSSCQVRVLQKIFGSELLVLAFRVRSVFFGGVSPMFLLYNILPKVA